MRAGAFGYRMPAEWEPHRATWLAWPHERSDWPQKFASVSWVFSEIVRHLTRCERVAMLVRNAGELEKAARILRAAGIDARHVEFHHIRTNRSWLRDSGPIFARSPKGRLLALDFGFNGWARYGNFSHDDLVPRQVAKARRLRVVTPMSGHRRIVLEGGAVDVDGRGRLLATEECLLSKRQERNPGLDRSDYEEIFRTYLGARQTVWLGQGIVGDDTHGHVDDIARFVRPGVVIACTERDPRDENHAALQDNARRLRRAGLEVVALPMPSPIFFAGARLPASYANFYIANRVVLVPTFNDSADSVALGILRRCFPRRDIIGIHCRDLVLGLGAIHCLTQQEPMGVVPRSAAA